MTVIIHLSGWKNKFAVSNALPFTTIVAVTLTMVSLSFKLLIKKWPTSIFYT